MADVWGSVRDAEDPSVVGTIITPPVDETQATVAIFEVTTPDSTNEPVCLDVAERTEEQNSVLSELHFAFEGFGVLLRFAGEPGLKHFVGEHLDDDPDRLCDAFMYIEQPIVVVRVEDGLWFFVPMDGRCTSLRKTVLPVFGEHYDSDEADYVSCKEVEVTIFDLRKEHSAVSHLLPQFPRLKVWAQRCEDWFYETYLD